MIEILIPLVVVAVILAAVIAYEPVIGVYVYLFGCAILLTTKLPVVREKLAGCDFVMLLVLLTFFVNRAKWKIETVLPIQYSALRFGLLYVVICGLSIAINAGNIVEYSRSLLELAVYVYGFVACVAIVILVDDRKKWRNCLIAWCFGAGVVGIVSCMAASGIYDPTWARDEFTMRISSTLRESGQISSYCGPILPFLVFASSISSVPIRVRRILYFLIVPVMVAILGSGSRIALTILCMSLVGVFVMRPMFPTRSQLASVAFWIIALAAVAGLGKVVYDVATDTSEVYTAGQTSPFERPIRIIAEWWRGERVFDATRPEQGRSFAKRFVDHPLLGSGLGNYTLRYRTHEIHNSYVSSLAETGCFGFSALLIWLAAVWRNGTLGLKYSRDPDYRLLIACMLFGFVLLLMYQMTALGLRQRPWWFIPALIICIPRILIAPDDKTQQRDTLGRQLA
jgi:hypothetical protein